MKIFFTIMLICAFLNAQAQVKDNLDDRIHGMTTIVTSELLGHPMKATGFYYFEYDSIKQNNWSRVKAMWLITNKHAIIFKDTHNKEHLANKMTFYLRYVNNNNLEWNSVTIDHELLKSTARFSKDTSVDVVAIPITRLITKRMDIDAGKLSQLFGAVSEDLFPDRDSTLTPQVSDDVVVIGYPSDFYDKQYLFPIVKTGIIASRWGLGFNGRPYFLIDSKLFPQSSGSLVLSKPSNLLVKNGVILYNKIKQFVFLGIYSGEPVQLEADNNDSKISIEKYDLGVVWYYTTILDIIKQGVLWNK